MLVSDFSLKTLLRHRCSVSANTENLTYQLVGRLILQSETETKI